MTDATLRYYLAGPMSGYPENNFPAFITAAHALRRWGLVVVNPAELTLAKYGTVEEAMKVPWETHLARDIGELVKCDAVVVMPGWEKSPGATLEVDVARRLRMPVETIAVMARDGCVSQNHLGLTCEKSLGHRQLHAALDAKGEMWSWLDGRAMVKGGDPSPATVRAFQHVAKSTTATTGETASDLYENGTGTFITYEANPLRQEHALGGVKDNRGKSRIDLIPSKPLVAIGEVLAFGARKYKPNNWRLGLSWEDTFASLQRHLLAWHDGEDTDPETKLAHLAHAGCQLMFLIEYAMTQTGEDDRWAPAILHPVRMED